MKHTKGPWKVQRYSNYYGFSVFDSNRGCIAERWYDNKQSETYDKEMEANAHLIASAPEMLEALRLAHKYIDIRNLGETAEGLKGTLAKAIAKAEGRE